MEFHWSYVELEKSSLVVCENIGKLQVTLVRKGDLSKVAFVGIEAHDRTTKASEDYIASTARQVQFDPGKWFLNVNGLLITCMFSIFASDPKTNQY